MYKFLTIFPTKQLAQAVKEEILFYKYCIPNLIPGIHFETEKVKKRKFELMKMVTRRTVGERYYPEEGIPREPD